MKTAHNIEIASLIQVLSEMLKAGYKHVDVSVYGELDLRVKGCELTPPSENNEQSTYDDLRELI